MCEKKGERAQAGADVSRDALELKHAMGAGAVPTMDYRRKRRDRFIGAAKLKAVDEVVVEEEQRDYQIAEEAWKVAQVAEKRARAVWGETKANLEAAKADVNLKSALIQVAAKTRDRAQALADYAR